MEKIEKSKTKKQKETLNVFRFIMRHANGTQKAWFIFAAIASLISVVASFAIPQVIRITVDSVIGTEPLYLPPFLADLFAPGGGIARTLLVCAGAAVAFSVLAALFTFASRMGMATGTEHFVKNLRDKLYRHVQYLPFKWHVENQTGDIIQRCTSDMDVVKNFISSQLLEVVRTVLLISIALGLMFSMNVTLSLVALAFIPLIIGYSTFFFILVGRRFMAADEAEGELTVMVQENLTGARLWP